MIRQSSQPEAAAAHCCCSGCSCPLHASLGYAVGSSVGGGSGGVLATGAISGGIPSAAASLRQLREPGDGIAGIAADSLRINGGIRQFRQVTQMLYYTLSLFPLFFSFYIVYSLIYSEPPTLFSYITHMRNGRQTSKVLSASVYTNNWILLLLYRTRIYIYIIR